MNYGGGGGGVLFPMFHRFLGGWTLYPMVSGGGGLFPVFHRFFGESL